MLGGFRSPEGWSSRSTGDGLDGAAGDLRSTQIGLRVSRSEVAHFLGHDGKSEPVFRVVHEFPHPRLGKRMSKSVRAAALPERLHAGP